MADTYTYDLSTEAGMVRLLITDTDISEAGARAIFSDAEIDAFLAREATAELAAAAALETMARSTALVLKKIRLLDLQTDGPAVAAELRASAAALRESAAAETVAFADADIVDDTFARREKYVKELERRGLLP